MKPSILRALLIATLLAAQLGTVALFALDAGRRVADELDMNARATLLTAAETVTERTLRFLKTSENTLQSVGAMLTLGALDLTDEAALEQLFLAHLKGDERLGAVYIGRADGSFLSVSRQPDGMFRTERIRRTESGVTTVLTFGEDRYGRQRRVIAGDDGYDPRTSPWYGQARVASGIGWTDPYLFFSSERPGISAAVAIRDTRGAKVGVLGLDIDLHTLSGFIGRLPGAGSGTAVLLDHERHVIGSSRSRWLPRARHHGELPLLGEVSEGPLAALASVLRSESEGSSAPLARRVDVAGEEHLGLLVPFRTRGVASHWSLLLQIPVDDYNGALVHHLTERSWWLLGALLTLSLLAMGTILGVTAPVSRIHRDATVDRLTGVFVRAEFERRLVRMAKERRATTIDGRLVVAALDLDGFKAVNDTFGHGAGDEVLAEFARRLRERLRSGDLIGRAGGDEFLLALQLPVSADVRATLERIREAGVGKPVEGRGGRYRIGATVGVAVRRSDEGIDELVRQADRALIEGKAFEKNRVYVAIGEPSVEEATGLEALAAV